MINLFESNDYRLHESANSIVHWPVIDDAAAALYYSIYRMLEYKFQHLCNAFCFYLILDSYRITSTKIVDEGLLGTYPIGYKVVTDIIPTQTIGYKEKKMME